MQTLGSSSIASSPQTIFPPQVILQILLGVPARPLHQFRLVSKSWYKIITSSNFRNMHLHHSKDVKENFVLLALIRIFITRRCPYNAAFGRLDGVDPPLDIEMCNFLRKEMDSFWFIAGSCNGIVCLVRYNGRGNLATLFNPITREYKDLPPLGLASDVHTNYGFGYDANSKDYVVVRIAPSRELGESEVEYWSSLSTDNSWQKIENIGYVTLLTYSSPYLAPGVHVSGLLHWLVTPHKDDGPKLLFAFDIVCKRFIEVPLPDDYNETGLGTVCVTELNGYLCFPCYFKECIKVWSMRKYMVKDSWSVMFSIDVCSRPCPDLPPEYIPIRIIKDDVLLFRRGIDGYLVMYNLTTKSIRDVKIERNGRISGKEERESDFERLYVEWPTVFVDSLVGLNSNNTLVKAEETIKE